MYRAKAVQDMIPFDLHFLLHFWTYVNSRAILLHTHIVAAAQDFAFGRDETCADGDAAFVCAFLGLFKSGDEACVGGGHVGIDVLESDN